MQSRLIGPQMKQMLLPSSNVRLMVQNRLLYRQHKASEQGTAGLTREEKKKKNKYVEIQAEKRLKRRR